MNTNKQSGQNWHAVDIDAVMQRLDTSRDGLSRAEARRRLEQYGPNRLRPPQRRGPVRRFLAQFHNVLIYVLLAAALMTAFLQHWVDTGVILGVVVLNAVIGFIQEGKAEKALAAIRNMLSQQAAVKRDGRTVSLPADELVPGDVVVLQAGDKVPADLRLFAVKELRVDEAILTGESSPVTKNTAAVDSDAPIGDRSGMAYSGTLVTAGHGSGIVVATGDATEVGRISTMLGEVRTLTTPLLRQTATFGKWLTVSIIVVATATFAFGVLLRDYSAAEMFLAAVGLSVAAIPEGLPAIMTITLAIGVRRMAARNAIIRRLPAVETLGSVTVICSDKTGTLTRNEMTVQAIATADESFDVSGVGYDPHGNLSIGDREVDGINDSDYPVVHELVRAAVLCNDAVVECSDGVWRLQGDPTEGALVTLGLKSGLDVELERREWPRTDVIPFESQHRFMATLHHDHAGQGRIYVKGAPERVLEMCAMQRTDDGDAPLDTAYWQDRMEAMAGRGHRLLAIAVKIPPADHRELRFADVESDLILLGVVGIIDPPRDEAVTAVHQCQAAGIRVKMVTGDHATTAAAIAAQMGIGRGDRALTGRDLDAMDDAELTRAVTGTDVFARTSPEHKLLLIKALQKQHHVVSMTGDGVNDAPALKRADVGIAMGLKGTEVAKEAAEMVLVDDNFASIANAVEEGRTVYDNLKKTILFILPTNGGEALTLIAAIAFGRALPITPVQILWINMITAVTLALALAFEPPEPNIMKRPPRDPREPILSPLLVWRVVFVALILVAGTFGLFLWERTQGADIATARTVAVNTLVFFEIFYLFNARYITEPVLSRTGLFGNRYVLIATGILIVFQLGFTYLGTMQTLFGTTAIDGAAWLRIITVAFSVFVLVELEKAVIRRRYRNRHAVPSGVTQQR